MRGLKLFVRAIDAGDSEAVREFLTANGDDHAVPACGLLGKLLGRVVAVMAIDLGEPAGVRIERLLVASELRRKQIGRIMMNELEELAAKMERDWLIIDPSAGAQEFLRRVGFVEAGDHMIRKVQR
jgi:ribosomal protein S18 acetylase RimI-like enzyme